VFDLFVRCWFVFFLFFVLERGMLLGKFVYVLMYVGVYGFVEGFEG